MWRWVGGLVVLAVAAWVLWPSSVVHVTLACLSSTQSRGMQTTVVHGPTWLGVTYFVWTRDDPTALAKLTVPARANLTWLQFNVSERDVVGSAPPSRFTFTIGVNLTEGREGTLAVGVNTETQRSMPLTEAQVDEASRFIARNIALARGGVSISTATPSGK